MSNTPPGWYPEYPGSSQLRYWDGQRWTEQTHAPGQAPGASPEPGSEVPAARPWYRKKRFAIPLGLVLAVIAISALAGDPDEEPVVAARSATTTTEQETTTTEAEETTTTTEAPTTTAAPTTTTAAAPTTTTTTAAPTTTTTPPPPPPPPPPAESVSLRNAKRSAEQYLDFSAFSRTGLIGQLEFEGYSNADATTAVDSLDIDFNAQAAKSAEQYLEFSAFSRSGLIDQLEFEGYTPEQAEYGVSTTGL